MLLGMLRSARNGATKFAAKRDRRTPTDGRTPSALFQMNVLDILGQMDGDLARQIRQSMSLGEGSTNESERESLETAFAAEVSAASEAQQAVALSAARALSVLRHVEEPELPLEVQLDIAERSAAGDGIKRCTCMTNQAAPQLTWGVANAPANGAYTICASCFRLRSAVVTPRIPQPDGVLPLRPLGVNLSKPTWKACRHFHREGSGNEANQHAVRHRMSGLHSFRTIACGEWLIRGSVTYELIFPTLVAPASAGIGVVTPHTDVNTDTAWCAGTRGWVDSWGLCIEGQLDEEDDRHEIRAIPGDAWAGRRMLALRRVWTRTVTRCARLPRHWASSKATAST